MGNRLEGRNLENPSTAGDYGNEFIDYLDFAPPGAWLMLSTPGTLIISSDIPSNSMLPGVGIKEFHHDAKIRIYAPVRH